MLLAEQPSVKKRRLSPSLFAQLILLSDLQEKNPLSLPLIKGEDDWFGCRDSEIAPTECWWADLDFALVGWVERVS